jgi:hypothetical protein
MKFRGCGAAIALRARINGTKRGCHRNVRCSVGIGVKADLEHKSSQTWRAVGTHEPNRSSCGHRRRDPFSILPSIRKGNLLCTAP